MKTNSISIPLEPPRRGWIAIVDRDATLFSSREIAYACYEEAFDKVISEVYSESEKLGNDEYAREYNPFHKTEFYRKHYPKLTEKQLERAGEASWQFYLSNFSEAGFNHPIAGMADFLKKFKAKGNLITVLTTSEGDGRWMRHYGMPFDELFSLVRLRKEGKIEGGKREGLHYILGQFGKSPEDAVTIGDHPNDHIAKILSVGVGFGLECPDAREELKSSVKIYASSVSRLQEIFGL
jgi:FMN phosphatase YigB (HAD superfamily)